jgi:valyl-tRNA synthetase
MKRELDKTYNHKEVENAISSKWETANAFKATVDKTKQPYTIILPPPNASGQMHMGNILMVAIEDLLIRWKRMQGFNALWVPGTDHAGFETQTTFERELKKQGKSRFDFDRNTLYKSIWDFVFENKALIETQLRQMGASVDWSRYTFTLDPHSIDIVYSTFEKMEKEGLIYRDDYVVNYSFKWGTTFSDAEVTYKEQVSPLYYIKYGPLTVATVRPESKLGDTALAVHPDDERYSSYIGKTLEFDDVLGKNSLPVIADKSVDPKFGTGVLKVTPAHSKDDYEMGIRNKLPIKSVIGIDGKMTELTQKYEGMTIKACRSQIVADLQELNLIEKIDENYVNMVPVDYRSGDYIENLVLPNWYVKVDHPQKSLKKLALDAVKSGKVKIHPKWREVTYVRWVENMRDWAISRQIVWGIRVPVWYDVLKNPNITIKFLSKNNGPVTGTIAELLGTYSFEEVEAGLQNLIAPKDADYLISSTKPSGNFLQETDTFDTWFSSGQWPLVTLKYPDSEDFKYFYPTDVLETGWEIVTRWVSRMVMFGTYLTGQPPFKNVYLHGHVKARDGRKMSKSLGNQINPGDYLEKYGVDSLRMGLIFGTANGKDFSFPHDKVLSYRNFANKIWNMARFTKLMQTRFEEESSQQVETLALDDLNTVMVLAQTAEDTQILQGLKTTLASVNTNLEKFRFADAGDTLYHFMWDELAAKYIEYVKDTENKKNSLEILIFVYLNCLKMLHPFMPFITEAIWDVFDEKSELLATSSWPNFS